MPVVSAVVIVAIQMCRRVTGSTTEILAEHATVPFAAAFAANLPSRPMLVGMIPPLSSILSRRRRRNRGPSVCSVLHESTCRRWRDWWRQV